MSFAPVHPMVRWMPPGLSSLLAVSAACTLAHGNGPLPMVGQPAASYEGVTLFLDPLDATPAALLLEATDRLPPGRRSLTLHGLQEESVSTGLPRFRVTDVLPEFWAEPAVWHSFRAGPATFCGQGRELRSKDWTGRPFTDRRAYALDNGLPTGRTEASLSPSGPGKLESSVVDLSLALSFEGVAGRIYALEYSEELNLAFRNLRTWIAAADGRLNLILPADALAGFYRLVELPP